MKTNKKFNKKVDSYYDQQKTKYSNIIDLSKPYNSNMYVDDNGNHIIELIYDGKIKIKAEYELIGMYNISNSMWYWGWAIDLIDKSLIKSVTEMKEFPEFIKENFKLFGNKEAEDLYFKTDTASFYTDHENIEKILKLTLYQLKSDWYLTICHGRDNNKKTCDGKSIDKSDFRIEYLLIKKILTLR